MGRSLLSHTWHGVTCQVCGTERRRMPSGDMVYRWPGFDSYRSTAPSCKSNQGLLFGRLELNLPAAPGEHEPQAAAAASRGQVRKGALRYEKPRRDESLIEMTIELNHSKLVICMDGDGRWGGHESDWAGYVTMPQSRLPWRKPPVRIHETFPIALEVVETLMRAVRGVVGSQVRLEGSGGLIVYNWLQVRPQDWQLTLPSTETEI